LATKCRAERLRPRGAPGWTRTNTLPGKNRLLCIGATEAMQRQLRPRRHRPCMTCHPLESNQNLPVFGRARRPLRKSGDARFTPRHHPIRLSRPIRTVSLSFHYERSLGESSIHLCCRRPQFGLRGSNSHFQSQSLAFCRLNEARVGRSGEIRTVTSRSQSPVRFRYATHTESGVRSSV
jgi:hypothetical protein